jgi:methyl-accepting chemotaxis protein
MFGLRTQFIGRAMPATSTSEDKIRALGQTLATIEFAMDGTILDANPNFLTIVDCGAAEIRGQHHSVLIDAQEATSETYRLFWQALREGQPRKVEHRRVNGNGREVWLQASYNPIRDRHGRLISVFTLAYDVTTQKLHDADFAGQIAAINKSQAVIHFALDGTVLDANPTFLHAMGYNLDEVQGRHHRMFVDATTANSDEYAAFWRALRAGEFQQGDFRRITRGGKEVWLQASYNPILDMSGRPFKVVKYATEVTAQKLEAAEAHGQSEAISRAQAVIQFDLDGHVLDANTNFCEAMGYGLDEIRGKHHSTFVEPAYAQSREYQIFWERLRAGETIAAIFERVGRGGRRVSIQATYNPVLDLNGKPYKIVKYAIDVTRNMQARARAVSATQETRGNVQAVAAAAEEMNGSITSIAETMTRSKSAVDQIHAQAQSAAAAQARLQAAAGSMDGVVQAVSRIAEQINLLALNATIEAARAGSAGRGFAVVANEVKCLAAQAQTATGQISGEIFSMQKVSVEVGQALLSIGVGVDSVQAFVTAATASMEEQRAATREISGSMQQAAKDVGLIGEGLEAWA